MSSLRILLLSYDAQHLRLSPIKILYVLLAENEILKTYSLFLNSPSIFDFVVTK